MHKLLDAQLTQSRVFEPALVHFCTQQPLA